MTGAEMITELQDVLHDATDTTVAMLLRWLHRGHLHACQRIPCTETSLGTGATVSGTKAYAIPADFLVAPKGAVQIAGYAPMTPLDWRETLRASTVSGRPTRYAIRAGQLWFDPVPDAIYTYTIYYRRTPAAIANDSAAIGPPTGLPDEFHEMLLRYAHSRAEFRKREYDTARELRKEWNQMLAEAVVVWDLRQPPLAPVSHYILEGISQTTDHQGIESGWSWGA